MKKSLFRGFQQGVESKKPGLKKPNKKTQQNTKHSHRNFDD